LSVRYQLVRCGGVNLTMERGRIPNPAMKPEHEALEAADARARVYCTKEASSIQTLCRGVFCQQEHRRRRCQLTGSVQPYGSKPESPGVLRASLPRKLLLHLPKHRMALAENVQAAIRAKNSAARGVVMARLAARKWIRIRLVGAERALDQIPQAWGMPDVCFQYVSSDIGSGRAIQIGGTTIVHCELHHVTCTSSLMFLVVSNVSMPSQSFRRLILTSLLLVLGALLARTRLNDNDPYY